MAAIGPLFALVKKSSKTGGSDLRPLPAAARQDLVLLSVLSPVMVSKVAAPVSRTVGCSDASLARGVVCTTQVDQAVAEHLWQTAGQKGWYTRLETEHLRGHTHDKVDEASSCDGGLEPQPGPARPLALDYDFLEVRSGGPWASEPLRPSFAVGPVIDAAASPYFRIADCRCLEWVLYLLQARKLRAILVARPGLGSSLSRKRAGDLRILAATLAILLVAGRCDIFAVLFHPP